MRNEIISFTVGVLVGLGVSIGYNYRRAVRSETPNKHLVNAEKALD